MTTPSRPDGSRTPDPRAMNAQLMNRLLSDEPTPIPEGGYGLRVLEVPGRITGRIRRTPIGLLRFGDRFHLVCPDRGRDWPANVDAARRCTILGGTERIRYRAEPLTGMDAARVVGRYLQVVSAPWAVAAFAVPTGATPDELVAEVGRMAVFALTEEPA